MANTEAKPRDPATKLVEDNLRAILHDAETRAAAVRNYQSKTNTAIYDFLAGRTASVRVDTLAKWAEALDVPLIALFAPPDRLVDILALLRTIDKIEASDLRRLIAVAQTLSGLNTQ